MSEQVQIDALLGQEPEPQSSAKPDFIASLVRAKLQMIGLGSTIGTGLFLGSAISVKLAGPSVVLSFLIGAIVALPVMWALAEMSAAHPTAGAFGAHAQMYLNPWAGFAVR